MDNGDNSNFCNIETQNPKIDDKQPLNINYDSLFASNRDEPLPEIVVVPSAGGDRRQRRLERRKKAESEESSSSSSVGDDISKISESDIRAALERSAGTLAKLGDKLPDKGAKYKALVQRYEEEIERRKHRPNEVSDNGNKKPAHSANPSSNGELGGLKQAGQPSERMSEFASSFRKKMEPNSKSNTDDESSDAFKHQLPYFNRCEKRRRAPSERLQRKRANPAYSSKEFYSWIPKSNSEKHMPSNGRLCGRAFSTVSPRQIKEKPAGPFTEKDSSHALDSDGLKNEKTVVLVDEDELEPELVKRTPEAKQLPPSTDEGKIYYPSREDPESLEIFRSELKCLEPGECLTSTIMNFYIRYLQETSDERSRDKLYFFNTYFYSKLQEAISYQKDDQDAFFLKFRRWWRGVNIFEKSYVFLPINEDKHWSLVIICIPHEEDESGPIILHLDSLGLHCSRSIFANIRSLLKNEGEYLSEDSSACDNSISDRRWDVLLRRTYAETIKVPRQTNDYDCGLFVLYYMERFIEEAPDRLKRENLSMFGKSWFKPKEASMLRGNIRNILQGEFHRALEENDSMWQPVCLPVNAKTVP